MEFSVAGTRKYFQETCDPVLFVCFTQKHDTDIFGGRRIVYVRFFGCYARRRCCFRLYQRQMLVV